MTTATIIISALLGFITVILIPSLGWFIVTRSNDNADATSRIETKLDVLPTQFAKVHQRISGLEVEQAKQGQQIKNHINDHGRHTKPWDQNERRKAE